MASRPQASAARLDGDQMRRVLSYAAVALVAAVSGTAWRATQPTASAQTSDFSTAIVNVANNVRPAVVQITNMQAQVGPFNQGAVVPAGVGSGVIYDSAGHVLTNDHVVAGA